MNEMLKDLLGQPRLGLFDWQAVLMVLSETAFLSYFCLLTGAVILALIYDKVGDQKRNEQLMKFSRELYNKLFINKWIGLLIGAGALFLSTAVRSWYLNGTSSMAPEKFGYAILLFLIGLSFAYSFQNYLNIKNVKSAMDTNQQESKSVVGSALSGLGALVSFIFSAWFYSVGIVLSANEELWVGSQTFLSFAFDNQVLAQLAIILALSLAFAGAAILRTLFVQYRASNDKSFAQFVGQRAVFIVYAFLLPLPVLILTKVASIPDHNLSFWNVFWLFLALAACFGIFHMIYALKEGSKIRFDLVIFPIFKLMIFFLVLSNSSSHTYGIRNHVAAVQKGLYESSEKLTESKEAPLQLNRF